MSQAHDGPNCCDAVRGDEVRGRAECDMDYMSM
jgi:hypothetical protein